MAITDYVGMDAAWLTTRKGELQAALSAATTRGSSFSQPDLTMSFPAIEAIRSELAAVNYALLSASGSSVRITVGRCA